MNIRKIVLGSLLGLLFLAVAAALSPSASALLNITGDWVVTASESYVDDHIVVTGNNSTNGNLIIMPGADLHFENISLVLPNNRTVDNQGYFEVRNSSISSPSWFFYLRGAADLQNVTLFNCTRDTGNGRTGTYVANTSVNFDQVRWNMSGFSFLTYSIHIHVVMDFKNNRLDQRGTLYYDLGPISGTATVEIAGNRFALGTGFSRTDGLSISNVFHTGSVTYMIHDNNFTDGSNHIYLGAASPSTVYNIYNNTFRGGGGMSAPSSIEAGQPTGTDRFAGSLFVGPNTFTACSRAARLYGVVGANVNATFDGASVTNCANGITANEGNWLVYNATITNTDPQYQAESNGHISVWTTSDTAMNGAVTAAGARIEHFTFLNIVSLTWQDNVPILGDLVSLKNATGVVNFQVDAQNWTPREVVWWGLYFGQPSVDNRDLRPQIVDGPRTFTCTPPQFFVSEGMGPVDIVCTDDSAPGIVIDRPAVNWLQNSSTLFANGTASEYGSGLNTFEWSFDNASWGPVTLDPGASLPWSVTVPSLADGTYTLFVRATDRVGLATYAVRGNITVDTTPPTLVMPVLPTYSSSLKLTVVGTTEPLASLSSQTSGGNFTTATAGANGSFTITISLSEGQNLIWITVVDRAGNPFTVEASILVDLIAPSLVVFQNATELTGEASWTVAGLTEVGAAVRVNGVIAARAAENFSADINLVPGLNAVTVVATDAAGNAATWYGAIWSDSEPPALDVTVSTGNFTSDGLPVTKSGTVPVTGTVHDNISRITNLSINGVAYSFDGSGAFFVSLPVAEGDNAVVVTATDAANNVATRVFHVLRDTVAPTAAVSFEAADAPIVPLDGLDYTTGSFAVLVLDMSEDGQATVAGSPSAVSLGRNAFNVSLHEGLNSFLVTFRDRAWNNGAPRTVAVTRDTTAPTVRLNAPLDGAAVGDEFVAVDGLTETGAAVTVNGNPVAVDPSGAFHTQLKVDPGASLEIRVVSSDPLGNTNTTAVSVTRKAQAVTTADSGGLPSIALLALGLAAGLAVGFLVRGRSRDRQDEGAPGEPGGAAAQGPAGEPKTAARGPKGPRGPQAP